MKNKEETKYDCIMLYCDINKKDWKKKFLSKIDKKDLYTDPEDEVNNYGLEDEPHITLLWGIHAEEVDRDLTDKMIKSLSEIEVESEKISIFENEDYDVVKIDIIPNDILLQYRKIFINTIPNTQTFPDYHPHMTLAYVKKGEGKKYKEKFKVPIKFNFNKAIYSDFEKNHTSFKLKPIEEFNESMAGFLGDIETAIKLNNKEAKKTKPINNLRKYMEKEFKNIKTFKQFKNKK